VRSAAAVLFAAGLALGCGPEAPVGAGGVASRVFVVERTSGRLAVYDLASRSLLPRRIEGLGDLRHATMTFSRDLRWGFVATRNGQLGRVDLESLELAGKVYTSQDSIDIAIRQDGGLIATAEYRPGGVTFIDPETLEVKGRLEAVVERDGRQVESRVTGIVDAPGNRFVCVLIEGREVWIVDGYAADFPILHRIPTAAAEPYDAMITPDGRHYVVGHLGSDVVTVVDLARPESGGRGVSIRDPLQEAELYALPVKLPHMASWAVAGDYVFVPLVGQPRLAVLDRTTFELQRTIQLRGDPVYAVRSPTQREIWVSFSGEEDDAFLQVIDTETLEVTRTLRVGGRIYHLDFTPRGSHVLVSANRDGKLVLIDAGTYEIVDTEALESPSGIFGAWRAFTIGL
jgi:protein NirF